MRFLAGDRLEDHLAVANRPARAKQLVAVRVAPRCCGETTGLVRYFEPNLFSANDVARGKPAPDLFLHVAAKMGVHPRDCIVVEDSPVGVAAATAAGMTPIGFAGGSHVQANLPAKLSAAGARAVIADMRVLKSTIVALRGW